MKKFLSTAEIRSSFLQYFANQGHSVVPSSSLVPQNDGTLFFTNAGMVQFKDNFLGKEETAPYVRATTVQRCLRVSGKHNDLTNVGYTNRHHTFFEMLGNFSFGDYFKKEAIHYAWDFLTEILAIPPQRLWITVHSNDHDTETLWQHEFKLSNKYPQGLSYCGDKDNFWSMGETGPCGYCSEIFYDHGEQLPGDPPGGKVEGERYVEIWNLVFMQFDRNLQGHLTPLPKPSVDTGMGLERIAAAMQGTHDNYQIDIFIDLTHKFMELLKRFLEKSYNSLDTENIKISARVAVDHIRSSAFLIADGIVPSNEKAGYVLRSIIRRAVYYLYRLGIKQPFFFKLVDPLVQIFDPIYPETKLLSTKDQIIKLIKLEEIKFLETLERGIKILDGELAKLDHSIIPGIVAFTLHDTYGLPVTLTEEIAEKRGLTLDMAGFEREMEKQRLASRGAMKNDGATNIKFDIYPQTHFIGYSDDQTETKIVAMLNFNDGKPMDAIYPGDRALLILETTPFYGESGGQVGDTGEIRCGTNIFRVENTQKQWGVYLHCGELLSGSLSLQSTVMAKIDATRRTKIKLIHTATHLLHKSLRLVVGDTVSQKGSFVDENRLRFDFAYASALESNVLMEIENLINQQIRNNLSVKTEIKSREEAKNSGAYALFNEKYGANVRVISIDKFSQELCGGTHVNSTGEIGLFKIVSEASIASGVRRIEALTGENALKLIETMENQLKAIAQILVTSTENLVPKIRQLLNEKDQQKKELTNLKNNLVANRCSELINSAKIVDNIKIIVEQLEELEDNKSIREMVNKINNDTTSAIIVLTTLDNCHLLITVGVTDNLTSKVEANLLLQHLIEQLDHGKGGGRKNMAQGGGAIGKNSPQKILESVLPWIKNKLEYLRVS